MASLTDDNAALAQRADAEFTVIYAILYQCSIRQSWYCQCRMFCQPAGRCTGTYLKNALKQVPVRLRDAETKGRSFLYGKVA